MEKFLAYVAYVRKALIQIVGLATALLTYGLLPEPYAAWTTTGVAIVTTVLHFWTTNGPKPGSTASRVAADNEIVAPPTH